jgi:predicted Zn-ribbon and HTH transcriptional regulator
MPIVKNDEAIEEENGGMALTGISAEDVVEAMEKEETPKKLEEVKIIIKPKRPHQKPHKIKVDGFRCEKCGWEWIPRRKEYPRCCPNVKCHVVTWDKPRNKEKRLKV